MIVSGCEMDTVSPFSIPIGAAKIPQDICDELKKYKGMIQNQTEQNKLDPSNIEFTILDKNLEIKKALTNIFAAWINNILGYHYDWLITTSWITENQEGKAMTMHNHRNCLFSGVLYFDTCVKEHPPLCFRNPILEQLNSGWFIESKEDNPFTKLIYEAPYREGLMLFFPSYLQHFHQPFKESSVSRKSLACNFFPVGEFGTGNDSSLNTNWFK